MKAKQQDGGRILLVDFDDARRETRVKLLESHGYDITLRDNYVEAEKLDHEGRFDMMIVALHRRHLKEAAAYADRVRRAKPDLPILLLTDAGVYAPRGTLGKSVETDGYAALLKSVADMFESSTHIRELRSTGRAKRRA